MCEVNEQTRIDVKLEVIHVCMGINKFYNRERELSRCGQDVLERKVCFLFIKGPKPRLDLVWLKSILLKIEAMRL